MEDWAAYINKARGQVKIVGSQEFFASPAAMPAFEKAYGFKLKHDQIVALATGDTAVTEKAAAQGHERRERGDGVRHRRRRSRRSDLVVLEDPKGAQPIYQPAPTVRKEVVDKYPEIAGDPRSGLRQARPRDAAEAQRADRGRRQGREDGRPRTG